jgi:uncharacterized repeat protein (TIGR02543 family)
MISAGCLALAADPVVSNVRATQLPGTGALEILYDLEDADATTLTVAVNISTNGGSTWFTPAASNLAGAVGLSTVTPGSDRVIIWQGWHELPARMFTHVNVKILAKDNCEVAWYKMDDNATDRILVDSSVSACNATNVSQNTADRTATGLIGNAMTFRDNEYAVTLGNKATAAFSGDFCTISFWGKQAVANLHSEWFEMRPSNDVFMTNNSHMYGYYNKNYSQMLWHWLTTTNPIQVNVATAFPANTWTHWAFVRSGTNFYQYKNGAQIKEVYGSPRFSSQEIRLGGAGGAYNNTRTLDDIRIYDTALSPANVATLYNEGTGLSTPLVIAGEGVASETSPITVYDLSLLCTVTFDPAGGTVSPTNMVVTFDYAYGELPEPSHIGYTFEGWQATTNGIVFGVTSNSVVSIPSDHTLAASWSANTYTATFNPEGGEVNPISKPVTFDSAYGELPMPARNGYIFAGWWTGVLGSGTQVTALTVVTADADHVLYANWTDDPYLCPPADTAELSSVGSYDGFFFSENDFSDYTATAVRGTLTLKVTSLAGKLTAKVVTQTGSLHFSATAWSETEEDGTFLAKLETRGGEALDLHVSQNRVWGRLTGGKFGNDILTLDGARNRFAGSQDVETQTLLNGYRGYYTVALPVADSLSLGSADAAPRGAGYLTITVANRGAVKIAGMLADGTKVSQSSRLILFDSCGPEACVPFFVPLYSRTGWTGGLLWIDPADKTVVTDRYLGWFIRWEKPGAGPDGFSELLDSCGGFYDTTSSLEAHYRFSAETNALSYHFYGGIADLQTAALPSGISVTRNGNRLAVTRGTIPLLADGAYDYSAENSAMTTLSFTSRTGIFNGNFSLYYDYTLNGRLIHKTIRVPYAGVLTPARSENFTDQFSGQGFCLVTDNDPAAKVYRLRRSYRIILGETP